MFGELAEDVSVDLRSGFRRVDADRDLICCEMKKPVLRRRHCKSARKNTLHHAPDHLSDKRADIMKGE